MNLAIFVIREKRKLHLFLFFIITSFLFFHSISLAQISETKWVSTGGPLGGLGYDARIHPTNKNIMFVTDNYAGVARSDNTGETWYQTNSGISIKGGTTGDAINIFSLTIDPNDPNILCKEWGHTLISDLLVDKTKEPLILLFEYGKLV